MDSSSSPSLMRQMRSSHSAAAANATPASAAIAAISTISTSIVVRQVEQQKTGVPEVDACDGGASP